MNVVVLLTVLLSAVGLLVAVRWLLLVVLRTVGGGASCLDDHCSWLLVVRHLLHVHHSSSLSSACGQDHDNEKEDAKRDPENPFSECGPPFRAASLVVLVVPAVERGVASVSVVRAECSHVKLTPKCHS